MHKKFKHGLVWQDFQHDQLLTALDSLNQARGTQEEMDQLEQTINFLEFYTSSHFDLEEAYMDQFQYPLRGHHRLVHKEFVRMVNTFKMRTRSKKDSPRLVAELCKWLKEHILSIDRDLADFLKDKMSDPG